MGLRTADIRKLNTAGRYGDGNGLYLVVTPNGTKSWIQRFQVSGKRTDRGLGGFPAVSLTQARRNAIDNRAALDRGENPWADGKQRSANEDTTEQGIPTFRESVYKAWEVNREKWRSDKYRKVFIQQLELHAMPVFGDHAINEISQREVIAFLQPLRAIKPEAGRKMRQRLSRVFKWAMSMEYRDTNPAGEAIDDALTTLPKAEMPHTALPYSQVRNAIQTIRDSAARESTKLCFEFLILTASRSNEARGARWEEIDRAARTWTIPAHRSKDGKAHTKPLSIQAMVLLDTARQRLEGAELVFPSSGKSDKPLSENALSMRARKENLGAVPHGFRASFKTWATETQQDRIATEFCLSHNPFPGVEGVYVRTEWVEGQAVVMDEWANYLDPLPF